MIEALILGLVSGLIPGPVLAAVFTEVLQTGFTKAMRIILLAMAAETAVALVSLVVFAYLGFSEGFFQALSLAGAGVLLWIASQIWKIRSLDTKQRVHFSFGKIVAMILANGVLWTFWITVCIPKAVELGDRLFLGEYVFLAVIEVGWLLSTVAAAVAFSRFRQLLSNPKVVPVLFKIFALSFGYFALSMLYKSVRYFFF